MAATRTKHQREADLDQINIWTLQGKTLRQCAAELAQIRDYEVSHVTIKHDLDTIATRWREGTNLDLDSHKAKELARIDLLEQTYWKAWEQSLEQAETTTTRQKDTPVTRKSKDGQSVTVTNKQYEASLRKEERDGNPAYLVGVERCIKMRVDLLGLNAPTKSDTTVRVIDMTAVEAEITRQIEAGQLTREKLLEMVKKTGQDESLADKLFAGARTRIDAGPKPGGQRRADD